MSNNSADNFFGKTPRPRAFSSADSARRHAPRGKMPSSAGYLVVAFVAALALFFGLWWMLVSGGDEAPWIPAGLAASVVLLVAFSAREVVMRRAWTRYLLEQGSDPSLHRSGERKRSSRSKSSSSSLMAAQWRAIQKQSEEADAGSGAEAHFEAFQLCQDYLASTDEALKSNSLLADKRVAIKAGQERVRGVQKHHLLTWARNSSRSLTYEAQQRSRTSDKIETANRALHCLESALQYYPQETELHESSVAIREFIASVKVAHWVELAERSAFKGHYRRAIERYKDALFYLNRETVKDEARIPGTERITREIELLRSQLKARRNGNRESPADKN